MRIKAARFESLKSSFLSCEKDIETILRVLFIESKPYDEQLKRLLVINARDCLDSDSPIYKEKLKEMTLTKLRENGYIKLEPKIRMPEHEEVKAYILISLDNFVTNKSNPEFRDCVVNFDIICHTDYWDIGNCRTRPLKIAGYIDGLLNGARLSGIGTFQFLSCNELILSDQLSGYTLSFTAIHGSDDRIPDNENK